MLSWSAQFGDIPEILPPKQPFWDRPGVLADKTVVESLRYSHRIAVPLSWLLAHSIAVIGYSPSQLPHAASI